MHKFTENLKFLTKNRINQNQLAGKLGVPRQSITRYLNGREPSYDKLIIISEVYNVTIDDLLKKDLSSTK